MENSSEDNGDGGIHYFKFWEAIWAYEKVGDAAYESHFCRNRVDGGIEIPRRKANEMKNFMDPTEEILLDVELMEQIKESREDFKVGRYKRLHELIKWS